MALSICEHVQSSAAVVYNETARSAGPWLIQINQMQSVNTEIFQQLFFAKGWQLMITIVVSTALVMLSSALTFMLGNRVKRALYRRTHHAHH